MSLFLLLLAACNRSENQIVDQGGQTYSSDGSVPTPVESSVIDEGNAVCTPPGNNNDFWEAISDDNFRDEISAFLNRFSNNKGSSFMGVRWNNSVDLSGIYTTPEDISGISSSDDWTQNPFQNQDSSGCEVTPEISAELKRVLGLDRNASALVFLTNDDEGGSDYLVFTTYSDSCTLGAYLVHSDDGRSYDIVDEEQIGDACDEVGAVDDIMSRVSDFAGKYGDRDVEIYVPK